MKLTWFHHLMRSTEPSQNFLGKLQPQVSKAASYSNKFNTLARKTDAIRDNRLAIVGCLGQLCDVATSLHVGNLMIQSGKMNRQLARQNTSLSAARVGPGLAMLFSAWCRRPADTTRRAAPACSAAK